MKNYIQPGDRIDVLAPAAVVDGQLVRVGLLAGVAIHDAASGAPLVISTEGVYDVTKAGSQAWTVGQAIFGVGTTTLVATTAASGNILLGVCVAPVGGGAGETIGRVRLNASAPAALAV